MPRKARLVVPGAIYHIMARSLEHHELFPDDSAKRHFLHLFETSVIRSGCRCYAWVLMDNHYHVVLRLGEGELWEVMKPLHMRYAQYHSKRTGRRGPLFMDRYKSIVTQDQKYLEELVRYVHLNPIRAGICRRVEALCRYSWGGHSALMGRAAWRFQDTKSVLSRFGRTTQEARFNYIAFLKDGLRKGCDAFVEEVRRSNAGSEAGRRAACWVIGDPEFTRETLRSAESRRLRISRFEKEGGGVERIAKKVGELFNVPEERLRVRQRGGSGSEARKVFAFIAGKEYGVSNRNIGDYLGVGNAAVSALANAGRQLVERKKITM